QGHDLLLAHGRERSHAGAHRLAVNVHGAGAALPEAAAEARPVQSQVVAQGIEQRHVGIIDRYPFGLAVDVEWNRFRHRHPLFALYSEGESTPGWNRDATVRPRSRGTGCKV